MRGLVGFLERDAFGQVGQGLGGFGLGGGAGGGGANGEPVRIGQAAFKKGCERAGVEFSLGEEIGGADGGKAFGVGRLMVVSSGGERDEDRWAARDLQFRHR